MHDSFAFVSRLPAPIPVLEVAGGGADALAGAAPERLALIVASAEAHYGRLALAGGGAPSRRRLGRARNPYLAGTDAVAARLGRAGAHLLNLSFEWTCTSGVAADPSGVG